MATTLTKDNEVIYASFPIEKTETTADGDLIVYGKASDGSVDFDQQIVKPSFARKAVEDWFASGANIRVQHNAQRDPAGVGLDWEHDGDATWVKALVCEPVAKKLVAKGALRAYSVGIARPTIERDVTGKARGGIITDGQWVEISLVDRPANKSCGIALVKSVDGTPELSGEVFGTEEAIAKAIGAAETVAKGDVSEFNPADFEISFSPNDMAELVMKKMAQKYTEKRQFDPGVGGGVDRDKLPASDFAGPHRSFPIVNQSDVSDAMHLVGHADNPDAVRDHIRSIADRKGFSVPDKASENSEKVERELAIAKADGIGGEGALSADGGSDDPTPGKDIPKPEKKDEESIKEAEPDITKEPENPEGKRVRDMDADGDNDAPAGKAAMPPKKAGKKGKKNGKKLPPWLNKPADGDDGKNVSGDTEKCPDPKTASGAEEPADMEMAPLGDLKESPAKPHMKADGLTEQAMMRYKTIGMDTDLGILHDMTCPAFHPEEVAKVFPYSDFAGLINEELWQRKALAAATGKSIEEALEAQRVWQAAVTLKYADAAELNDYRRELYKAFRDANPGPTSFPTPCAMSPQKYNRPCITDGHAGYGSGYDGPTSAAQVATSAPSANGFSRPPLTSAHQSPSPSHMKAGFPYPDAGNMSRISYPEMEKEKARRALSMMHDHLNHMFPSSCPMLDQDAYRQEQNRPIPAPVGKEIAPESQGEVFGNLNKYIQKLERRVQAGEISEAEARDKLAKRTAQKYAEDLRRQVEKGMTSRDEVLKALGIEIPAPQVSESVTKAVVPEEPASKGITPDVMKSMMTDILREQMAPLQERIVAQEEQLAAYQQQISKQQEELSVNQKRWDALADTRDPSTAAFTGLAFNPVRQQAPAGITQQAEVSKSVQGMMMRQLERTWRTSENPSEREAAYKALLQYQGKVE